LRNEIQHLFDNGYCIISGAFGSDKIAKMRSDILANLHLMSNTRLTKTAFHIAGFHRFLDLEHLHREISANNELSEILRAIYDPYAVVALGLSDITINRSQPWHTDLLRGKYANFVDSEFCWNTPAPPCLKALVYLQDGQSLRVVSGSHLQPIDLSTDIHAVPQSTARVTPLDLKAGDIVLMDIRLIHRGATEYEMQEKGLGGDAKILVSTVFGDRWSPLTQAMQVGNMHRLVDWDNRNSEDGSHRTANTSEEG
jgi:hypothetical protein